MKEILHTPFHWLGLYTSTMHEAYGRGCGGTYNICNQCGVTCDYSWIDLKMMD